MLRHFAGAALCLLAAANGVFAEPLTVHFPATSRGQDTSQISGTPVGPALASNQRLAVSFVDVGQGDCTLLRFYDLDMQGQEVHRKTILVDCGTSPHAVSYDKIRQIARDTEDYFLETFGNHRRHIDTLVITHPDSDHFNLVPFVLRHFTVGRILIVGDRDDHGGATINAGGWIDNGQFVDWLDERAAVVQRVPANRQDPGYTALHWFDQASHAPLYVHLLAAAVTGGASRNASNTGSIALMVSYGLFDLLMTGDASGTTDAFVMATTASPQWPPYYLDCDVYKLAHHGAASHGSTSPAWVNRTRPEVAVVSAQFEHRYGHPHRVPTRRVAASTVPAPPHAFRYWHGMNQPHVDLADYDEAIFFTGTNGTIELVTDGVRYTITCDRDIRGISN